MRRLFQYFVICGMICLNISQITVLEKCLGELKCEKDCLKNVLVCIHKWKSQQQEDAESDVYDLCIVGAGLFGTAAARHASANVNLKVCLIGPEEPTPDEYKDREIFGSHYDEGRIMQIAEFEHGIQTLATESVTRFHELEQLSGISFYDPVGSLMISAKNSTNTLASIRSYLEGNIHYLDITSNGLFERQFPYLRLNGSMNAILLDDHRAGVVNPRRMIEAQKNVSRMQGCDIIDDVVEEVEELESGVHKIRTENNGVIKAKRVLVCAGGFTNFKKLIPKKISMFIGREMASLLRISPEEAARLSSMPTMSMDVIRDEMPASVMGSYILPPIRYPDGNFYLKIGHLGDLGFSSIKTLEETKEWYNSKGVESFVQQFAVRMKRLIPGLKIEEVIPMTCITSATPTRLPYIDRLTPTLTLAAVGNSVGATICEEVGRIAATLSATGVWDSEMPKELFHVIYDDELSYDYV